MTSRREQRFTETNKDLGARQASQRMSPLQTLNWFIGRFLSFSRRESSSDTQLEEHHSVTVFHNLIPESRKASNWESLMKCLVITSKSEASIRGCQIQACSHSPNANFTA